jgi:hypothetical protein
MRVYFFSDFRDCDRALIGLSSNAIGFLLVVGMELSRC